MFQGACFVEGEEERLWRSNDVLGSVEQDRRWALRTPSGWSGSSLNVQHT